MRSIDGVTSAHVTLEPPQARVEMARHVPTETLDKAVRAAGDYRLSEAVSGATSVEDSVQPKESLFPLFLIVGYIAGTVALIAIADGDRSWHTMMRHFMAGFFLVFSFFKLLDLRGFADAYRTYDVLVRAWSWWASVYPFIELALGIAYLVNFNPLLTNLTTLVLMLLGAVGVFKALLNKQAIRCACLGTALNLPMTTITLVEDLGMAAMAAIMLLTL
ncbi:MAG: heavy-metal-associated domain-containing protein [Planctomycetes bacterium]|nr:heavy-metal-associated domain-containing protein [Planctomycetota bacterium]